MIFVTTFNTIDFVDSLRTSIGFVKPATERVFAFIRMAIVVMTVTANLGTE